ncbi:transcription antitermination factor NusB [uncultured Ruminococcus sp.]|uniref:transcription antitermination factor NusB n=1 Tax=uncultured Ruminococcus sp. TaxID=165186 RepID=UPI0029305875|nr:transcription antitermination factor NusB [uncultured Ruminococcus sp.]
MCQNDINPENPKKLSRYKIREQAFFLCFESLFSDTDIDELADNAGDARDEILSDIAVERARGTMANNVTIDERISANLKEGWKITRISKVSLALLRLAIYEMLYEKDIPVSVSINEAVELSKKYTTEDDAAFVNGVLGAVAKTL